MDGTPRPRTWPLRRQLRANGLCPGGKPVVAQLMWAAGRKARVAYLYDLAHARPKRTATAAQLKALGKGDGCAPTPALDPASRRSKDYCIPRSLVDCPECAGY